MEREEGEARSSFMQYRWYDLLEEKRKIIINGEEGKKRKREGRIEPLNLGIVPSDKGVRCES